MPAIAKLYMRLKFSILSKGAMIAASVAAALMVNDSALAAACCSGGNGIPGIIVGDEKATLTVEISSLHIQTDVSQNSIWRDRKELDTTSTFRIQYTQIFSDRFQAGFSTSIIKRDRADQSSAGLADTSFHLGYEATSDSLLPQADRSTRLKRRFSLMSEEKDFGPLELEPPFQKFLGVGTFCPTSKSLGPSLKN